MPDQLEDLRAESVAVGAQTKKQPAHGYAHAPSFPSARLRIYFGDLVDFAPHCCSRRLPHGRTPKLKAIRCEADRQSISMRPTLCLVCSAGD
jgi:hypothetical protein